MPPSPLPLGEYLFNRQYLLAQQVPDRFRHWSVTEISDSWKCVSKNVSVEVVSSARGSIAGIGELLDPREPLRTNREVLESLLAIYEAGDPASAFLRLETELDYLGGRWLLVTDLEGEARVYPDTVATKSTVYTTDAVPEFLAASQPQLLAEALDLRRSEVARQAEVEKPVHWPGTLTPYDGIRRLRPNFYLDLTRRQVKRFWPREEVPEKLDFETTAFLMATCLRQLMLAASTRWPLKIGLTAGYDSRLTLGAAAGLTNVEFFTQDRSNKPAHEVETPLLLAEMTGIKHRVLSPDLLEHLAPIKLVMRRNNADMRSTNRSAALHSVYLEPQDMLVLSHCAHALRRGESAFKTVAMIRRVNRRRARKAFGENSGPAELELAEHLATLPSSSWLTLKELWALERLEADVLSNKYVVIDSFGQVMALQNCRYFQTLGFALPERFRFPENRLLTRIFEQLNPALLELPFNSPLPGASAAGRGSET